ncbi:hypothetical protein [uncultured Tateyamaria sp.]|uniref:hypothetical protein n=1 Tax=uncultured Tateyamaria sp. TaxID=455651 RepID=UPI002632AB17|nr:hypothetical protein [uncultured Tateyamaria sp.]
MTVAETHQSDKHARVLKRRARRTRLSKWLGRLIFSLIGVGLMLGLRAYPNVVQDVIAWAHDTPQAGATNRAFAKPSEVRTRIMLTDKVPVRRGNALPGHGATPPANDTQAQADAIGHTLRTFDPGG